MLLAVCWMFDIEVLTYCFLPESSVYGYPSSTIVSMLSASCSIFDFFSPDSSME